ncbi:MAG: DEAD/DEAH box helicase [Prevotellaceae bacterium]|jgi:superfamily II DNA/RNA helicase|nr:DEAD/DEAH box helicase [Prevotellaceae bacterium]
MKFTEFNLDDNILEAVSHMGFDEATPIQEFAIPRILAGKDLIACAQTGTGKTAAFVLPILHKLANKPDSNTNTLILVPTRELAIQIDQAIQGFSYYISVGSIAVYGGGDAVSYTEQERALKHGRDIIVATPGRLLSHLAQGYVNFKHVKHLILDEADKMMDMGFAEDIEKIIKHLPAERQTLMFSATMPPKIRSLSKKILHHPEEITLAVSKPAEGVTQAVYLSYDAQKIEVLKYLLKEREDYTSIIVFTSQKAKVNEIVKHLRSAGHKALGISSDLEQDAREEVLIGFRSKRIRILVATDVMSRGIDIKEINMVINFDAPRDAEDYVHRIGRTARANTQGEAVTLINPRDMLRMHRIEELIEMEVPRLTLPEALGEQPKWSLKAENDGNRNNNHRRGRGGDSRKPRGNGGGQRHNKNRRANNGGNKTKTDRQ